MIPIGISTIDELIKLGGKLVDISSILLNKKNPSKDDQAKTESAIKQFNEIKQLHHDLKILLETYNTALSQMMIQNNASVFFSLCTHKGYKEVEKMYNNNIKLEVAYQQLVSIDLLSIKSYSQSISEDSPIDHSVKTEKSARAFTLERWINIYRNDARSEIAVMNCYLVVQESSVWKVHHADVFTYFPD